MSDKFDVAVLGGGPGGYVAAIRAAQLGAKVVLIEKDKVGGTCLNRGCIPTKALIACINLFEKMQKAESFGISAENVTIDLGKVIARKDKIVAKIVSGVEFLLQKNGVEVIHGIGKVLEPGKVEVEAESRKLLVVSRKLILATGSSPVCLPGGTFDHENILSSDDLLDMTTAPEKINIIGGGVIGIHFTAILNALGTRVTIFEALPEILAGVDEEVVALLKRILNRKKVEIKTNTRFSLSEAKDKTLVCIGRTPNTLGLEALGLRPEAKEVWVNEKMETSVPGIYAVGDLVSSKMLAHVAYEQGVIAAENAMGRNRSFSYDYIPYGIYTHPEVAGIGLTEIEAKAKHQNVKIGKFSFAALGIAVAMGEVEGFIKIIAEENGKILGVHIIGPEATELIGAATLAIGNDLKIEQLAETFQSHPSYPEGLQEAALSALKRSLHALN